MKTHDFVNLLLQTGEYKTSDRRPRKLLNRLFSSSDVWFYLNIARVIICGSIVARRRGQLDDDTWAHYSYSILRAAEESGGEVIIEQDDYYTSCEKTGPVVYVANHMSLLETFLLPSVLLHRGRLAVVVKESLLEYPFFGSIMKAVNHISVARANPREDLKKILDDGSAYINHGVSVLIFPQSTRSAQFVPKEFNSIGVKLAKRTGVQVVPIALSTDFLRNGRMLKDFGRLDRSRKVRFYVGAPRTVDSSGRETHEDIIAFISGKLAEWS